MDELEKNLLCWAQKLPLWQRDLLRRLAHGETLAISEYRNYASEAERIELSKPAPWATTPSFSESTKFVPLDASHLQATASGSPPVVIDKITHLEGANDLALGATLNFANSGLTIVAGRNGSGKSGYTRIIKQVAASRGPEKVLPNAFRTEVVPKAVITYQIGTSSIHELTWQSGIELDTSPLRRVRVFDSKSATAQLTSSAEVAYIPPTLQILADFTSSLKSICDLVAEDLNAIQCKRTWPDLQTGIGLDVFEHLGEKIGIDNLKMLSTLTEAEIVELEVIPGKLQTLTVSDPAKMAVQARGRAGQLSSLARNFSAFVNGLNESCVDESKKLRQRILDADNAVLEASSQLQQNILIPQTGSAKWQEMWRTAKAFFEDTSDEDFPDLSDGSVCPLCQQTLETEARCRFEGFAEFMKGEAQSELQEAQRNRKANIDILKSLPNMSIVTPDLIDLVSTYDQNTGDSIHLLFTRAISLRDWLIDSNPQDTISEDIPELIAAMQKVIESLEKAAAGENESADKYSSTDTNALEADKLKKREQELKLRQKLAENKSDIEAQHDQIIRIRCLQSTVKSCDTTASSKENTKLSKDYVSKVCETFAREANILGIDRVPVELKFDKSSRGVSYIKVGLVNVPNIPVSGVLSEGEQRVAAIAGFFADLTESGDDSTLVFDDPVSSLDQSYREAVARRLLKETQKRQVLVFTHDFTFVQYLYEQRDILEKSAMTQNSTEKVGAIEYIHIARSKNGTGEPTTAEQWRLISITERIKRLNIRIQDAGVLYRTRDDIAYEKEARDIIGAIRETWECFVELELLDGVVKRHERGVQTQRLKHVVDICDADVSRVELGMKVESRWITGHASPISDTTQTITPDQLRDELKSLTDFRAEVIKRRKSK